MHQDRAIKNCREFLTLSALAKSASICLVGGRRYRIIRLGKDCKQYIIKIGSVLKVFKNRLGLVDRQEAVIIQRKKK